MKKLKAVVLSPVINEYCTMMPLVRLIATAFKYEAITRVVRPSYHNPGTSIFFIFFYNQIGLFEEYSFILSA